MCSLSLAPKRHLLFQRIVIVEHSLFAFAMMYYARLEMAPLVH